MEMSDKCGSCASSGNCNLDPAQCGQEQQEKSLLGALNNIRNVIVVMSGKGGVGKSSVTGLIATSLARQGKKVGVLDADITGPSQPKAFGLSKDAGMLASEYGIIPPTTRLGIKLMSINFFLPNEDDPVIWRGPLLAGAVKQFWGEVDWRDLDYMIVDLHPSLTVKPTPRPGYLKKAGLISTISPAALKL
jgi:Mrp family chromosome partitioning ATPase